MKPVLAYFVILLTFVSSKLTAQTVVEDTVVAVSGVFEKVEVEASYPGGTREWIKYLQKNLNANVPVDNGAPAGQFTVIVQFIVDKEGHVSDIKAITKLGYGMEQEVVRIISKSGSWTPAIQKGRPVKAYRKQPVTFVVEDESFHIISETPFVLFSNKDNELAVTVPRVKPDDISITLSEGTVTPLGNGRFSVNVKKPGRVTITITNTRKNKQVGVASFEVVKKLSPAGAS